MIAVNRRLKTVADPGEAPPLFLHQTETPRTEKMFFLETAPPPPLSKGLDDRAPLPYLKVWIRH